MADFSPSALVAGQAVFNDLMKSAEFRLPDVVAFQVANKGEIANPSLKLLRTREDRSVSAYFPIRQAATTGTARAHNHTGARGDSLAKAISWSVFSEPYSISLKQADNNIEAWAEMYAATKRNALLNLMDRLDAWFVAQLLADKTKYNIGGGNGSFEATADNYEVPVSEADYFFQNAKATLEYNGYKGQLIGVIDDKANMLAQKLSAQGSANATNFGFQFAGMSLSPTTRTVLGATFDGSGLFFLNGLVAVVPWIPQQNRKPINPAQAMSVLGDFGSMTLPELGSIPIAVHTYAERANTSGNNGNVQDVLIQEELSIDIGYVSAQLSTYRGADDSVVYSVGQSATPAV